MQSDLVLLTAPAAFRAPAHSRQKPRIVLLSPRGPLYRHRGGIWKKTMRYAPLTLTTLASLVPPEISADIRIIDEGVDENAGPAAGGSQLGGPGFFVDCRSMT